MGMIGNRGRHPANPFAQLPSGPQPYTPSYSATVLGQVSRSYPGLAQYTPNAVVQWGKSSGPNDDRQLEFYPPWESENPNPGKITSELYNRDLTGSAVPEAVALDLLHYAGAIDPRSGQPVDPKYYALKQQLTQAIKARNAPMDRNNYERAKQYGGNESYDDYLAHNRVDAYIRAMVNPAMNPDWQRPGIFTPEMQQIGAQIRDYISRPSTPPPAQQPGMIGNPFRR